MRLTQKLCHQHIGFMFRKHWLVQGRRTPVETGAESSLKAKGIPVIEANEFIKEKFEKLNIQVIGYYDKPLPLDANHPNWKKTPCHVMKDNNVLLEGITQAQILTKTIIPVNSLPESVKTIAQDGVSPEVHDQVQKAIMSANIFDCEQKKLPKRKDPERPAVNFPRSLGITDVRRTSLTTYKLLNILERTSNGLSKKRFATMDGEIQFSFKMGDDLIQFQHVSNILLSSDKPISPVLANIESTNDIPLPDLHPIKHTVTIPKERFYNFDDIYPLKKTFESFHPHTSFINLNRTKVTNLFETDVTERQAQGRSLLHCFSTAAAYAKSLYGRDVALLPTPVTMQCVQTDGYQFYFGVLQLNTLDLNGKDGVKNVWYSPPPLKLFQSCQYIDGRPRLLEYNPIVFNYLNALYNNK